MESSPLSRHFDLRLKELDQQIHNCLKDVRRHLQELEKAAQQAAPGKKPQGFAEVLKDSLKRPPASGNN